MKKYQDVMCSDKVNELNIFSCDAIVSDKENGKNRMKTSTVGCNFDTEIKSKVETIYRRNYRFSCTYAKGVFEELGIAKMEEFMFVGLRKCIGVSKTEFKNRFNYSIDEIYGDVIDKFIKNNLLSENDNSDRIYLTDKGIDLSNYILSEFLL